jgi:hypothetical protein
MLACAISVGLVAARTVRRNQDAFPRRIQISEIGGLFVRYVIGCSFQRILKRLTPKSIRRRKTTSETKQFRSKSSEMKRLTKSIEFKMSRRLADKSVPNSKMTNPVLRPRSKSFEMR